MTLKRHLRSATGWPKCRAAALAPLADDLLPLSNTLNNFWEAVCDFGHFAFAGIDTWHAADTAHSQAIKRVWLNAMLAMDRKHFFNTPLKNWAVSDDAKV